VDIPAISEAAMTFADCWAVDLTGDEQSLDGGIGTHGESAKILGDVDEMDWESQAALFDRFTESP
jgi:hypothetical protein